MNESNCTAAPWIVILAGSAALVMIMMTWGAQAVPVHPPDYDKYRDLPTCPAGITYRWDPVGAEWYEVMVARPGAPYVNVRWDASWMTPPIPPRARRCNWAIHCPLAGIDQFGSTVPRLSTTMAWDTQECRWEIP